MSAEVRRLESWLVCCDECQWKGQVESRADADRVAEWHDHNCHRGDVA